MSSFKKILWPIDLSGVSPKLVPVVRTMAEKFDASVHVLFVARLFKYYENIYVPAVAIHRFEEDLVGGAKKRLDEFANEFFKDLPNFCTEVIAGDPAEEIVTYAADNEMDLIIIGTHGRKGIENILFGSVAEYVVKSSPVPVLSINPYKMSEQK